MRIPQGKWLPALLLLLLGAMSSAIGWLLLTESGLAFAVGRLGELSSVQIEVEGARGRLAGPLDIERISLRHARADMVIEGLSADYEPSELLGGRIAAEDVSARRIQVTVRTRTDEPATPPTFMPRWLSANLARLSVEEIIIASSGGTTLQLKQLGATVHISRTQIRFSGLSADAGNWTVAHGEGRMLARDPLVIHANSAWTAGPARELQGELRLQGDLQRMEGAVKVRVPGQATAALTLTDLATNPVWRAEIQMQSLDLAQWWQPAPLGPLNGNFIAGGGISRYGISGVLQGPGIPATGIRIQSTARFNAGVLEVDKLALSTADLKTRIEATARYDSADIQAFSAEATWRNLAWPLLGEKIFRSPEGELRLQGWETLAYQVKGTASIPGLLPIGGEARGLVTGDQLIVEAADVALLRGRVLARGSLGRQEPRAWTLVAEAQALDPAAWRKDLDGKLSFDVVASGYGLEPDSPWAGAISRLSGRFRGQAAGGQGLVRHNAGHAEFDQVTLTLGSARLALNGAIGKTRRLDAQLDSGELSRFLPELRGLVQASMKLRGADVSLSITGRDLGIGEHRAAVLSLDADLNLDDARASWARLRSSGVVIAGQSLANARLSLDGLLQDHQVELRSGAGGQAIDLLGQGRWKDGDYTLLARELVARSDELTPWQLDAPVRLAASAERAELDLACFRDGPRRVCVEARWQRDSGWSARAATEAFPLEALNLKVPGQPHYRGLLTAEGRVSGVPGLPWVAAANAEIRGAVLEYRTPSGRSQSIELGRTIVGLQTNARQHQLTVSLVDASAAQLTAELTAVRNDDLAWRALALSGQLRGSTSQLDLLPLLLPDVDRASGELKVDLDVAGTLERPLLQGKATLAEGGLDFYQANLRLRGINALMELQDGGLALNASANIGEGQLQVNGRMNWRGEALTGSLALRGENLLLVNVPEAKVTATPDLRFALDGRRIKVTGSVEIPKATIDPADTAGAVLPSPDEQLVSVESTERLAAGFEVETDVRLQLGEQVSLNAYGLSGRISGSLRTRSRPGELAVGTGELEVIEGRYRAYTRELEIERGKLLFAGGPVTDPGVDLRASRALPGRKVGVLVRGRLRKPQLSLYSEPPLPQTQIASLLIVGQSLDSLQDTDAGSLDAQRTQLIAQGSALVAGQLGRYVGLDEVGVAQDSTDNTALVLGKFLSPKLYVSYGISLVDEINTIKLRYTIGNNWAIRLESGQEASADIEYQIER